MASKTRNSFARRVLGKFAPCVKPARTARMGDTVYVLAKNQASAQGVAFPERVFVGYVAQVFEGRPYVNVVCANSQQGPTWWKANSVVPADTTDQTDNIFAAEEGVL